MVLSVVNQYYLILNINKYFMEGDNVDIIYLDFSKTFDTTSHYHLLEK